MKLKIASSLIHGKGIIAKTPIEADTPLGEMYFQGVEGSLEPSQLTRFINHSRDANVTLKEVESVLVFHSRTAITEGEELTLDYSDLHAYGTADTWYLSRFVDYLLKEKGMKEAFENHLEKEDK